jgi:hypothetical protein
MRELHEPEAIIAIVDDDPSVRQAEHLRSRPVQHLSPVR